MGGVFGAEIRLALRQGAVVVAVEIVGDPINL